VYDRIFEAYLVGL